jgi:hypothetical protein
MRRVIAVDVEGWIGLGIAEALGFLEAGLEGKLLPLHAGQDVITGAVHDAVDARHRVAGQRFPERLDDRDTTSDRRFEIEDRALFLGKRGEFHAMLGQQRLVGSHHMQAAIERRLDRRIGRIAGAAHQFDEEVDAGMLCHFHGIVIPFEPGNIDATVAVAIACRDGHDLDRPPTGHGEHIVPLSQNADQRSANSSQTCNADFKGISHNQFLSVLQN